MSDTMFDNYPFKIGQAVRCVQTTLPAYGLSPSCLNKIGVITQIKSILHLQGYTHDLEVRFDHIVGDRFVWFFLTPHIVADTSEEGARLEDHYRQVDQFNKDQLRREAHADKYL